MASIIALSMRRKQAYSRSLRHTSRAPRLAPTIVFMHAVLRISSVNNLYLLNIHTLMHGSTSLAALRGATIYYAKRLSSLSLPRRRDHVATEERRLKSCLIRYAKNPTILSHATMDTIMSGARCCDGFGAFWPRDKVSWPRSEIRLAPYSISAE